MPLPFHRRRLDPDAADFCWRSGATDRAAINAFVRGVKNLGLWANMVCWPLRSSQNAGFGSTAYSLGGLGAADATLTNGPTWGTNGAPFTSAQFANAAIPALDQDVTLLFCGAGDGSTYTENFPHFFGVQASADWSLNQIVLGANGDSSNVGIFHRNSATVTGFAGNIASGMSAATAHRFLTGSAKTGVILNVKNIGANTSVANNAAVSAGTATLNRMQLNGRWAGSMSLGVPFTCSFCGIVTPNISGSEAAIYTLYKSTLGQGLGLP